MLNGAGVVGGGVPGPAREGRELQRYSASGERLVAGYALIYTVLPTTGRSRLVASTGALPQAHVRH